MVTDHPVIWAMGSDCETDWWMYTHVAVDWVELCIWYGFAFSLTMLTHPTSLSSWIWLWPLCGINFWFPKRYYNKCVMCESSEFNIPKQNKGVCNNCDVAIWVVNPSGMNIKWCKGCKNFKKWIMFGVKVCVLIWCAHVHMMCTIWNALCQAMFFLLSLCWYISFLIHIISLSSFWKSYPGLLLQVWNLS